MDNLSQASLADDFRRVRAASLELCRTLEPEDTVVQSMPDVSPTKWHLAHVTWFFERMVLEAFSPDYRRCNDDFDFLFNSYYYTVGQMHARPRRSTGSSRDRAVFTESAPQALVLPSTTKPRATTHCCTNTESARA